MLTFLLLILASSSCVLFRSSLKRCRATNYFISVPCSLETSLGKEDASTHQTLSNIDYCLQAHKISLFDTHPLKSQTPSCSFSYSHGLRKDPSHVWLNTAPAGFCIKECRQRSHGGRKWLSSSFAGKHYSVLDCNFTIGVAKLQVDSKSGS